MSAVTSAHDAHDDHGPKKGIMRWLTTTNHKDIGTMYLVFALVMFFVGGAMALVIRAELFEPGLQFVNPQFFNSMTTMHALLMVFGFMMPAFAGFANWMIPMMIGAPDMALPRMNNMSFWLLVAAVYCWPAPCLWKADQLLPVGPCTHRWFCRPVIHYHLQFFRFICWVRHQLWRRLTLLLLFSICVRRVWA